MAGRQGVDAESSEVVGGLRRAGGRDETPAAGLIPHLEQLHADALKRIAELVEDVARDRAPSRQRDIDAFARLTVREVDRRTRTGWRTAEPKGVHSHGVAGLARRDTKRSRRQFQRLEPP